MPRPVSLTWTVTRSASDEHSNTISPLGCVNLIAFVIRFTRICSTFTVRPHAQPFTAVAANEAKRLGVKLRCGNVLDVLDGVGERELADLVADGAGIEP